MLKCVLRGDLNTTITLGITKENLHRLVNGKPIVVEGDEVRLKGTKLLIHYGETMEDLAKQLREAGFNVEIPDGFKED